MHASVTRQEDWGKGKDLRAYLTPESDASDGNDSTFTSLMGVETAPKLTGFEYGTLQKSQKKPISKTLTTQETLVRLRSSWQKGTNEQFEDLAIKAGNLSRNEAYHFRETLMDEGVLGYDPKGWLVWVR